jgi:surface protein
MAYKSSSRPTPKNPIKEENYDYLRWMTRIGKGKEMKFGFVRDPAHMKGMYKPLMRSQKLSRTNADIRDAVNLWCNPNTRVAAEERYGHISNWDVSSVTDMSVLFINKSEFNDDITRWDVSNVRNMYNMFGHASVFNQSIGAWNVSNVTRMESMFTHTSRFNQPIGNWNVSKVTDMSMMFYHAVSFNQDIGGWNVSNVTSVYMMFKNAGSFNQNISGWNVSKVTNISNIFDGCPISEENKPIFNLRSWDGGGGAKKTRRARMRASRKRSQKGKRSRKGRRTLKRGAKRRTRRR